MQRNIEHAIHILRKGGIVVFPTETAYGLGVDATNTQAVERLMTVKGREGSKTPPLIAADMEMVEAVVFLSDQLRVLATAHWPGPLTIVAPTQKEYGLSPCVVRDGTVAIRVSSHPVAQELSREIGVPIVSTSANVSGKKTCYDLRCIHQQFDSQVLQPDFYLDVGVLDSQLPSTIVMEQNGKVIVLRQGVIVIV